jgi:hypothetical protein
MVDLAIPQYYETLELENSQPKIEIVQQAPSEDNRNSFPENVKNAVDEIIKDDKPVNALAVVTESKIVDEENDKIESIFQALEKKL